MPNATMTSKGQVTIPKVLRDLLHLKPGDEINFSAEADGSVKLRPRNVSVEDLYGSLGRGKKFTRPLTIEEMDEGIAKAVREKFGSHIHRKKK